MKCVFKEGTKYPERILTATKSSITIMFATTGNGETLPPYVVYKAERIHGQWIIEGPSGTRHNRTKSGWFGTYCVEDWFDTVVVPCAPKKESPKLIIGDNLSSHLRFHIINLCKFKSSLSTAGCLILWSAGPLKKKWQKMLTDYKLRNPKEKAVNKCMFLYLLKELPSQ